MIDTVIATQSAMIKRLTKNLSMGRRSCAFSLRSFPSMAAPHADAPLIHSWPSARET